MSAQDVHTASGSRLGASDPRQEGPVDLRLVPPALAAWAGAAAALDVPGRWATVGVGLCLGVAMVLLALPGVRPFRTAHPPGTGHEGSGAGTRWRSPSRLHTTAAAAALLCAAAGAASAGLHRADARQGPVPGLAVQFAGIDAEIILTSDARRTAPRVRGDHSTPVSLLLDAEIVRLARPGGAAVGLRTPVLVIVTPGTAAAQWQRLLPSTRLRVSGRLAPPLHGGERATAVLRAEGKGLPRVIGPPTRLQRTAGGLRAGLRTATDGLGPDARALLPGLVVGDTTRVTPELQEAFRATDLTHLMAVSGANLGLTGGLRIGVLAGGTGYRSAISSTTAIISSRRPRRRSTRRISDGAGSSARSAARASVRSRLARSRQARWASLSTWHRRSLLTDESGHRIMCMLHVQGG